MEELIAFLGNYGWQLALIALAGIIILGVLKYCNVFSKLEEKARHALYLVISVGISVIGSVIYLACMHQLEASYVFAVAAAILALNQTFYAIYSTTSLKELLSKIVSKIIKAFTKKKSTSTPSIEDTTDSSSDDSQK